MPLVSEEGVGGRSDNCAVLVFQVWQLTGVYQVCFLKELLVDLLDFVQDHFIIIITENERIQ